MHDRKNQRRQTPKDPMPVALSNVNGAALSNVNGAALSNVNGAALSNVNGAAQSNVFIDGILTVLRTAGH
jgi:hypothetical protein